MSEQQATYGVAAIVTSPEQQQKFEKWGQFGLTLSSTETQLQKLALETIAPLTHLPDTLDELPESIEKVKQAKVTLKEMVSIRMVNTKKLDELKSRHMIPENNVADAIEKLDRRIVELKIEADRQNKAAQAAAEAERAKIAELKNAAIQLDALFTANANELPGKALKHALEQNIPDSELADYFRKIEAKYTIDFFTCKRPDLEPYLLHDAQYYFDLYNRNFQKAFENYDLQLQNKEIALKRQAEAEAEAKKKADAETNAAKMVNLMDASVEVAATPVVDVKIKRSYEAVISTDVTWAVNVWAAYIANRAKVHQHIRTADTRDWSKVTAAVIADALAAIKNLDNNFEVTGVEFREVVK